MEYVNLSHKNEFYFVFSELKNNAARTVTPRKLINLPNSTGVRGCSQVVKAVDLRSTYRGFDPRHPHYLPN